MRDGARRKIGELTTDARLVEDLADEVVAGAERCWNRQFEAAG
jgi:hypothetical protein